MRGAIRGGMARTMCDAGGRPAGPFSRGPAAEEKRGKDDVGGNAKSCCYLYLRNAIMFLDDNFWSPAKNTQKDGRWEMWRSGHAYIFKVFSRR